MFESHKYHIISPDVFKEFLGIDISISTIVILNRAISSQTTKYIKSFLVYKLSIFHHYHFVCGFSDAAIVSN